MEADTAFALAALVVALVALFNTVGQVLQQYYATADGYRRCSSSVMGEWSRFTRRKFIWKELRFETLFATPVIFLDVAYELGAAAGQHAGNSIVVLDGSKEMDEWPGLLQRKTAPPVGRWSNDGHQQRWVHKGHYQFGKTEQPPLRMWSNGIKQFLRTNTPLVGSETRLEQFLRLDRDPTGTKPENEPVTWISLMQSLQQCSGSLRACGMSVLQDTMSGSLRRGRVLAPAIRVSKKSWNFMPSDVVKPLAVTNVKDLAFMVQCLGCRWTSFKPEESILRAEGDGIMVTSAEVKSLGTVISFMKTDDRSDDRRKLHGIVFSPLEGATLLGFGVIHSDYLRGESHRVYDREDCLRTIDHLSSSAHDLDKVPEGVLMTLMTDLLGILAPVFRPANSSITYIVRPSEYISDEIVSLRGSLQPFAEALQEMIEDEDEDRSVEQEKRYRRIVHFCNEVCGNPRFHPHLGRPTVGYGYFANPETIVLLNRLQDEWEASTNWIFEHRSAALELLGLYISATLTLSPSEFDFQQHLRWFPGNMETSRKDLMLLYLGKCRLECVHEAARKLKLDPGQVEQAWIEMMFRGILWHAMHSFDARVVAVPPRYADSNLPIYIS